jgi:hypothetical protein
MAGSMSQPGRACNLLPPTTVSVLAYNLTRVINIVGTWALLAAIRA